MTPPPDPERTGQELYRHLVEHSVDGILVQVDGEVIYANPALCRMAGCERDALVGRHVSELLPPPFLPSVAMQILGTRGEGGLGAPVPTQLARLDGGRLDVEVIAVPCTVSGAPAAEVVIREIGGRHAVEAALARRDAALRLLLDQLPALVWSADGDDRITSSHGGPPGVVGLLGRPVEGARVQEFLAPLAAMDADETQRQARLGRTCREEVVAGAVAIEVQIEPLRDHRGRVVGTLGLAVDVTARRRTDAHLREAQKLDALGRLAGGVAHEVNNMMMIVLAHADLLAADQSRSRAGSLQAICRSAERAAAIAHQVLAFGRRQVLHPEAVDLNELVARTEAMMRHPLGEDIQLDTRLHADACVVEVDAGQVEQVLVNLLLNAREAMPRGGAIRVTVARRELGADRPRAFRDELPPGPYAVVAVADEGSGMDEATLERAFEPFFTTKTGSGSGLGLSTAYGIVRQSQGTVVAASRPGEGAVVEVWLPLVHRPPAAKADAGAVRTSPSPGEARRVLLVEDEPEVRHTLARALEAQGFDVVEACDGRHALELLDRMEMLPDVVVTDLVMPELGGAEVAALLADRAPGVPVLFVSGYGGDEMVRRGLITSDTPLLSKPFAPARLAEVILERLRAPVPPPRAS